MITRWGRGRRLSGRRASAWLVAAGLLLWGDPGLAGPPSIWERVSRPELDREDKVITEADLLLLKYQNLLDPRVEHHFDRQEIAAMGQIYLTHTADLLEQACTNGSGDPATLLKLAEVYGLLKQNARSVSLLEGIVRTKPPAPIHAKAYAQLALAYAHLGRVDEEIAAYSEALAVQPIAGERARLLANQAEAYMLLGNLTAAIGGYRAALALLSSDYLLVSAGPTTFWGLAVALDRSGDLDAGLDTVRLARAYDPRDEKIDGPSWFYLPDYDRFWYAAIGHWAVARKADVTSVRADAYLRAVRAWDDYVAKAAPGDRWTPIARVRRLQCERESGMFRQKLQRWPVMTQGNKGAGNLKNRSVP